MMPDITSTCEHKYTSLFYLIVPYFIVVLVHVVFTFVTPSIHERSGNVDLLCTFEELGSGRFCFLIESFIVL